MLSHQKMEANQSLVINSVRSSLAHSMPQLIDKEESITYSGIILHLRNGFWKSYGWRG